MRTRQRNITSLIIKVCLILFFIFCVIVPTVSILGRVTTGSFGEVVEMPLFKDAVKNSLTTTFIATCISVLLAFAVSWCLERVEIRQKRLFSLLFVIPMLIPSISHSFGLVVLLGSNGLLTNLFNLHAGIYGFWGIVTGSVMYSFPVALLMFCSILQYEDGMPYKAAKIMGIPAINVFFNITLPYMKKTFIAVFFALFSMIITDYGVPLLIGGKTTTLSVLMYNKAVGMMDYETGSVIGIILLVPAVGAFFVDLLNPENEQSSFTIEPIEKGSSLKSKVVSYCFCIVLSICVLLPIVAFCTMIFETKYPVDSTFTFYHVAKTINRGALIYLRNSFIYALMTAAFGTFLSFMCAYMTTRSTKSLRKPLHLFSILSMAIPGLVLGLSYVIFFSGKWIYGTILIVPLVNSIHFFASPYLMMYNALGKINPNLEAVGASLGIKKRRLILDVIVPKVKSTLFEMFVYFFVNSMMTISAVSFLAPPAPKPVALMINQFEAQLLMESAAFVSVLIVMVNILIKLIVLIKNRIIDERDIKEKQYVEIYFAGNR